MATVGASKVTVPPAQIGELVVNAGVAGTEGLVRELTTTFDVHAALLINITL